ncbi:hypothetical protein D3C79_421620 [compost metagenome]
MVDGCAGLVPKAFFQVGARHADRVQHLLDLDALAGVMTDVMHGLNHRRIAQRAEIGGAAFNHLHRRHQDALQRQFAAVQQLMQQLGGAITHLASALRHRRQRHPRQVARQLFVIDADHAEFLRHRDIQVLAHLQQMAGPRVGHGDDAGLLRQGLHPVRQPVLRVLPVLRRGGHALIHHALILLRRHPLAESLFALLRPAFAAFRRQAVKGKAIDPLLLQVHKRRLHQRLIIGGDIVHRRVILFTVIGAANADDRHIDVMQQPLNLAIVVIGDHPIAQPVLDVVDTAAKILFDKDVPVTL